MAKVGVVVVQACWKALRDKTEAATNTVKHTATSHNTPSDSMMQQLVDRMNEMDTT